MPSLTSTFLLMKALYVTVKTQGRPRPRNTFTLLLPENEEKRTILPCFTGANQFFYQMEKRYGVGKHFRGGPQRSLTLCAFSFQHPGSYLKNNKMGHTSLTPLPLLKKLNHLSDVTLGEGGGLWVDKRRSATLNHGYGFYIASSGILPSSTGTRLIISQFEGWGEGGEFAWPGS